MTPEYIKACEQAKKEGWLVWEPKWGDFCWHERYGLCQVLRSFSRTLIICPQSPCWNNSIQVLQDKCTWLPTEGQLMDMLKASGKRWDISCGD